MKDSTDEILKRIQARIDAAGTQAPSRTAPNQDERAAAKQDERALSKTAAATPKTAPATHSGTGAVPLRPDQIVSEVFTIAPTQIAYIAETFGDMVADGMNMRAFAPKIRELAERALTDALRRAKKQGKK